ncbi:MAG: hypothetical protein EOO17_03565 [Chloroflexi bacterium]|nr:MAG: hypothetical protein EOO17_03565 [Chloroflexota bacterium]
MIKIDASDGLYPATISSTMGFGFSKSAYQTGRNNLYYCTSDDRTNYAFGVAVKPGNVGYLMTSTGQINEVGYGPGDANVCGLVDRLNGTGSQMGHAWNGTTGTWQGWTN